MPRVRSSILTNTGHPLTIKEDKFINAYLESCNGSEAVKKAGYKVKLPAQYANKLAKRAYIAEEIAYRQSLAQTSSIATAEEILQFYTDVMRGKIKDQFDMDAPLSERIKAGNELAKRQIDMMNKVSGNETAEVKITLNWEGMKVDE